MLEDVKKLLGLDDSSNEILNLIIELTSKRLCTLIGDSDVPYDLQYIVTEVSVVRFNRIGSEGLSSHTIEGETQSWSDDDFVLYQNEIDAWKAANTKAGKVRFI